MSWEGGRPGSGAPGATTLWEDEALLVRRVPGATDVSVVTFSHFHPDPAALGTGFGEAPLAAAGIDAVHVVSRANDWFQNAAMPAAMAAIGAALGARPRITYGSSMGGYGAIRFAGRLGARRALALSPQYSIDPRLVPEDRRWRDIGLRLRFLPWAEVAAPPPSVILFDPALADARHAALWAAERPATLLPLRHAGHPVATILAETSLLMPLLRAAMEEEFDPVPVLQALRRARRRAPEYAATIADQLPPRHAAWKIMLMRRAFAQAPGHAHHASRLAILLYRAGRLEEAEAMHRAAIAAAPQDGLMAFRYSRFLERLGRFAEAEAAAASALALNRTEGPYAAGLARHLARQRRRLGPLAPLARPLGLAANAVIRRLDHAAWGRRAKPFGRLMQP